MWLRYSRDRALKSSKVRAIGNLNLNFKFRTSYLQPSQRKAGSAGAGVVSAESQGHLGCAIGNVWTRGGSRSRFSSFTIILVKSKKIQSQRHSHQHPRNSANFRHNLIDERLTKFAEIYIGRSANSSNLALKCPDMVHASLKMTNV